MGTTIEILAPYLPYSIEVEHNADVFGGRGREVLEGLNAFNGWAALSKSGGCPPKNFLPVLWAFPDLCTPLEDGTTPAIEVAKLAFDLADATQNVRDKFDAAQVSWQIDGALFIKVGGAGFRIKPNWNVSFYVNGHHHSPENQAAIIDYLRSKHFATPVNGKPLIEGIDFIRKTK